jgi:CRP/FNR family transcriptional regulator
MAEPIDSLLASCSTPVHMRRGTVVFRPGDEAKSYLLVLSGIVRVQLTAESGREITLYRVGEHEGCVLTTSGLLSSEPYGAEAICETDVEALSIPKASFRRLVAENEVFRDFVLSTYAARVADLILVMEETAFQGVPRRLARVLLERADRGVVTATHHVLAAEIGTAREVVSRQVKEFERRGLVRAHRGTIELVDGQALKAIGQDPG